jgi:hypothetical protein
LNKTWKPIVSGILAIIAGCMGIGGGISILTLGANLIDMPGLYDAIIDLIESATTLGMPLSVASGLGAIPVTFGIIAIIGASFTLRRMNWPMALTGSILAIPIGIPLGIISTVFLAQGRNEFK